MNTGKIKLKLMPVAHELISGMRDFFQSNNSGRSYLNEEPLREALFSIEQMAQCGKTLAETHVLSKTQRQDQLLTRLEENGQLLMEVRKLLADSIKKKYQITPAGNGSLIIFIL